MDKSITTTPSTPNTGIASGVDHLGAVRAEMQENPGLLDGTIGGGAKHTLDTAAATLAEKRVFSRPKEFWSTAHSRMHGVVGLGAVNRKATGMAVSMCLTPVPPAASLNTAASGFESHTGANHMATAKSPTTPIQGTTHHDNHQAELLIRASNHLALALHQLRHATGDTGIKTATGRANAAARALNQLAAARGAQ